MNVGDYVRTKDGILWKPKQIEEIEGKWFFDNYYWYDKNYVKISPNIIDLIEVGDYVNKKRVEWIGYGMYEIKDDGKQSKGIGNKLILFNEFTKDCINEKGIKSIVTKEQFEAMEYKVRD